MRKKITLEPVAKASLMETRLEAVLDFMRSCRLCPRECGVNRLDGELGICQTGGDPVYSSANLHQGEEPPISGFHGSGTIFLTGCNLRCIFCQNYPISHLGNGNKINIKVLAGLMLDLQDQGAHNINFVTPTHQASFIFEALIHAYQRDLRIPIVYNCGGYESLEMLRLWDGIVDIYMPDAKYGMDESAGVISNVTDYAKHNRAALKEMHRQVGVLELDDSGVATRGLLIRHLVLPGNLSYTDEVLCWIAEELSKDTYVSLMSQYFPAWQALDSATLNRTLRAEEYRAAVEALRKYGLNSGWTQPY